MSARFFGSVDVSQPRPLGKPKGGPPGGQPISSSRMRFWPSISTLLKRAAGSMLFDTPARLASMRLATAADETSIDSSIRTMARAGRTFGAATPPYESELTSGGARVGA